MGADMSTHALVLIPATATAADLSRSVAGVPALLRLLLCAQRAGLAEVLMLGLDRYPRELQEALRTDSRLRLRLIRLDDGPWSALAGAYPELEKEWWEGDLWVLPAGGVIDATLLRDAVQRQGSQPVAVIAPEPALSAASAAHFFRVSGAWLLPTLRSSPLPLSVLLWQASRAPDRAYLSNHGRVCAPVVHEANHAAVERGLFKGLAGTSDGWVDRYVNRKLSAWFSRWCLHTPLTPNQLTLIACAIGLLASCSFAQGGWYGGMLGALLLQWSAVIDCCDGEVARLKFLESTGGYYLDITCDNIVHVAVFAAIAWSGYQELGRGYVLLLGALAAFGTVMSLIMILTTRRTRQASKGLDQLLDATANRDFSLLLAICALTGTLQWLLWVLAIGVNLFWLIVLGLAWQAQRAAHG
jgi:phosphatidylglycerophosphate synthase